MKTLQYSLEWAQSTRNRHGLIGSNACLTTGAGQYTCHIAAIQYIQSEEQNKMVALQALYNAIPLGAFIALMTTLSGWGYELWGANIFWGMAAMGALALFIKLDERSSVVEINQSDSEQSESHSKC